MFTEGLDKSALRWVKEGSVNNKKEVPMSMSSQRPRIDPVSSARTGSRGFGLPPTSKFRSGHLPDMIPVSRTIPRQYDDDSRSESENDMSTDSEEEVYGRRYSLDSSPQDDRVTSSAATRRYSNPAERRVQYGSDSMYSEDVSSSRETVGRGRGGVVDRLMKGANRYPVGSNGYTEEESSDSAASSEFSSTVRRSDIGLPGSKAYLSEGYASSVPSWINKQSASNKNQKLSDDDNPSAPPFSDAGGEIKQEQSPVSTRPNDMPSAAASVATDGFERKTRTTSLQNNIRQETPKTSGRVAASAENGMPFSSFPARLPTFHASALGPWHAVIAYDACVRLCLHAWAKGCMEAPMFLENECALLRNTFGLQQVLLQSEEELLLSKRSSELAGEGAIPKPKKMVGKMKVQVRKVKMSLDPPTGCSFSNVKAPKIKMEVIKDRFSNFQSTVSSGWQAVRSIHFAPRVSENGSFSRQSLAYVQASTQYLKQVSGLLKTGVATLRSSPSSYDVQETYSSLLRLKSSAEEDAIRMQPGSGETHVFFPDSLGDDLIVEVQDSKGKYYGRVVAQVAAISEDPGDKLRWWSIYREPEHELVGKLQLFINYSTTLDENSHLKCGSVAETVAYDLVLEVAMRDQHFQQRNLLIHGPWKWLLTEFASYFGVSDSYTKLRYLSYVMDVATPTADCLTLVHDLLNPVVSKGNCKSTLSHQENRILGEIEDQLEQVFALAFENYKSLDESTPSGMMDVFRPATGRAAPALEPSVKLYKLLHDVLLPEAQNKLYSYFQAAAKKRSRRHLTETDEYVSGNNEGMLVDVVTITTAYQKMKSLCMNIRNEIFTDIDIHNQHILPSFIDLPNLSTAIYSAELCNRLRSFLIACPPSGPSPHVTELVIATADFQRDLSSWSINPVKGGVDAKELFHLYIMLWIQDKRLALLEACKLDKVKWSGVRTQYSTTPFVDEMYDRLQEILNDYGIIISRWPEYTFALENAIADIEKAVVEALDKQYADVVSPLKENMAPKKFGLKYVQQKLVKRSGGLYVVPEELGILLNSMKRMLDVLRPKVEHQLKSWGSCIPDGGNTAPGERLSEVTVMLRSKFRTYLQAVVEKLAENTRLQNGTKLKKILQDSKESVGEADIRSRMHQLIEQLSNTINHLHSIFETHVFVAICRGYWDRMGQDVLSFLENRKENRSWYKGSRTAVSILDDTFASQLQQLLGNALQEKDLEPPRSIIEVRSMLCKDTASQKGNTYYY
ncbi:Pesticidal crystal cry8Ba [Heracleum sosnowskyi]|uniref:Pesticidal crystal cry8Ba n=1 Tax=Heracleum sosnowskyi TaxID=360622 RepID=A0AAD8J1K6_9APIA|nr:Pesticidal crystal cry8Ba [Heracleum sosnowskyi]